MSESEPSRLQMSASSMGMGGSLPPLSLPPLSLPPMKTDQLGLSPMSLSYPSAISQPMHSPIPTNIASPSNHVGSPHTPQMFAQPPSSPLAYGNGSPRQVPVKRRFPTGQEQPVLVFQQPRPPIEKFNGTEPTAKQIKSVPGSPNSGSNPSTPGAIPTRYNNMEAAPSPSAIACSSSGMPSPSPSMSPSMPNGNGPVHSQAQPVQSGNIPASPSSSCMVQAPQPQQNVPVSLSMEYRGMPNGTLGSNDLPPSISLYHKPRMSEALGQGLPPVHHIQMRPTTSQYPQTVHPGHPNLGNLQNNQPGMHPHQQMIHVQSQQHAFQQGLPSGHQQPGTVHYPSGHPAGPPPQRLPLQHQQIAMHHAMMQQRMAQGGMVPIAVSQPPSQQQQQSAITQQQIKQLLANRLNTNQVMPPGVPTTPLTQLQVLTRPVATPQQRLHPGAVVHGQLHPSQANIPVRSILAAQQQVPNGRPPPGATVAMPLQMMTNAGQPLVHPGIVAQRPNPSASLQLARLIDERMAPTTSSKEQYRMYKRKFKYLVFENECYQEELRNLQRKLLKLSRDKNFLLDRLMQFEKVSDSSDDSDSSHKTVDDRPKTKKRIRTQRRRTSPHERANNDGVGSVSGSPSPCPSPASGNLLAQMLQQSTSGIHIPFGDGRVPNVDQMQARSEERKPFIQSPVPTEEVKQPLTHEGPPVTCDPAVNGYSSETFTPGGSQSQIVPGTQAQSHLNGMLPSNMDVSSPKDEELDEKPVV